MNSVLIIDDEEKIRVLLAWIIGLEGFDVDEAANCKTALKNRNNSSQMWCKVKACNYDLSPGSMTVSFDIVNLSSGMYLIQLNRSSLQKVIKQ